MRNLFFPDESNKDEDDDLMFDLNVDKTDHDNLDDDEVNRDDKIIRPEGYSIQNSLF